MARKKYGAEEMISSLISFHNEHGTTSNYLYVRYHNKPSFALIVTHFGTWNNALLAAGLPIEKHGLSPDREIMTKEKVLEEMKIHLSSNSKYFFLKEYKAEKLFPTADMVMSRFGSWRNAMKQLGIDVSRDGLLGKSTGRYLTAELVVHEAKLNWQQKK